MKKDMIFYCPKCHNLDSNWEISYSEGKVWVACRAKLGLEILADGKNIVRKNCDFYATVGEVRSHCLSAMKTQ